MKTYEVIWHMTYEDLWGLMRTYEDIWGHMRTYEDIWGHMRIYEDIWGHMRTYEDIWGHMRTYGDIWGHMRLHQRSLAFPEFLRFHNWVRHAKCTWSSYRMLCNSQWRCLSSDLSLSIKFQGGLLTEAQLSSFLLKAKAPLKPPVSPPRSPLKSLQQTSADISR